MLPSFKGLDAHKQAIDYGVKISGCTVHLVDEHLDHGAIIMQKAVEVDSTDTPESLSKKIIKLEHESYVEALKKFVNEKISIQGRKVVSKN